MQSNCHSITKMVATIVAGVQDSGSIALATSPSIKHAPSHEGMEDRLLTRGRVRQGTLALFPHSCAQILRTKLQVFI